MTRIDLDKEDTPEVVRALRDTKEGTMSRTEKFEVSVTRKQLGYLFTTCMESGFSRWVHGARLVDIDPDLQAAIGKTILKGFKKDAGDEAFSSTGTPENPSLVWWGQEDLWELTKGLTIELKYDREEDDEGAGRGVVHLRIPDLLRGLSLICSAGRGETGLIDGDFDGPDADSWLQFVVFGKLVYG